MRSLAAAIKRGLHKLGCGVALVACSSCALTLAEPSATPVQSPDRHILVMIKEPMLRHFRPDEAYGMAYRPGTRPPASERTIAALNHEFGLSLVDDWPMPALGLRCFLEALGPKDSPESVIARLAADPRVESVELVQHYRTLASHNDAYYGLQSSAVQWHMDELHRMATGRRVRIAQIDSGTERSHPDLAGQLIDVIDLVNSRADAPYLGSEGHGTEVAGIIAAKADNGIGIVGVAPNAHVLALRACWQLDAHDDAAICSSFTLAKALQYALLQQVHVLNMSLSGPPDRLLIRLLEQAHAQGISIVGAVDPTTAPDLGFPANLPFVIAVSAAGSHANLALPAKVVLAPGQRVLTTTAHASWGYVSGNSFAAAHVSGMVALLLEASPGLSPAEVGSMVQSHSHASVASSGVPMLDACGLLAEQSRAKGCPCCQGTVHLRAAASVGEDF